MQNKFPDSKCSTAAKPYAINLGKLYRQLRSRKGKTRQNPGGSSLTDAGLVRVGDATKENLMINFLLSTNRKYQGDLTDRIGTFQGWSYLEKG
jgi:hypothetical protein